MKKKKGLKERLFIWEQEPLETKEEYEARLLYQEDMIARLEVQEEMQREECLIPLFWIGFSCLIGAVLTFLT